MTDNTLAAYTGPSPATGYVGYINISILDSGDVRITIRPESPDGSGTTHLDIPPFAASGMFAHARAKLEDHITRAVEG